MFRTPFHWTIVLVFACASLVSCGGRGFNAGGVTPGGTAPIVLAMTDTPPTTVSILSGEVMLTGATLNPGNVSILAAPATVELTRLQTDIAYISTASVTAGSYTSVTLTFANPSFTIENDTGAAIGTCGIGAICTILPTPTNLSTTRTLPQTLTLAASSAQGLLVDVNIDNLLSTALNPDFNAGTTVSQFTPVSNGPPIYMAEDVVGQVTAVDATHNTFTLQNSTSQHSLVVDSTSTFFQFPSNTCPAAAFSCLQPNQILSVDISFRADGTAVARNIVFEDSGNTETEVEGMIVDTTNLPSHQFTIVTLNESTTVTGLNIGAVATVQYSTSIAPLTVFDMDFFHADTIQITPGFTFASQADLLVGQHVQLRRTSASAGTALSVDRVRLRTSRITGSVSSIPAPNINLTPPSIFTGHGTTAIVVQTSLSTILTENQTAITLTLIPPFSMISVRGPLFNVGGTRTLVASKVVLKPQ